MLQLCVYITLYVSIKYICNYIEQDTCSLSSPSNPLLPLLNVSSGTLRITLVIVFSKAEMVWLFNVKWLEFWLMKL